MINIKRYTALNSALFIIGVFSNITIVLSVIGIYTTSKVLLDNRMKLKQFKMIASIMLLFILLDCIDISKFIIELI